MNGAPHAPDLEDLATRLRARDVRDDRGLALADGARFVHAALAGGHELVGLLCCPALTRGPLARRLLRSTGAPAVRLSPDAMRAVSLRVEPDGLVGIVRQRWRRLPRRPPRRGRWLLVDRVRSPGNLGTLLRTALASGVRGLISIGDADPYDPSLVRASMGALFGLELTRVEPLRLDRWRRAHRIRVVGASGEAITDYRAEPFADRCAIAVGHERAGLSQTLRGLCDGLVRLPMEPGVDSLNLAVAGSLLLYEAYRRQLPIGPGGGERRLRRAPPRR